MNTELITALESAKTLLSVWEDKADSSTVQWEIMQSKKHIQRAIEWEMDRPDIEKVKP